MRILALDLGTQTGWALLESNRVESGVRTFDVKRGESPGMRYLNFNRWLDTMACLEAAGGRTDTYRALDLVVYEQTHQRGGAATEVAAGFATRVQEFCARYGIDHAAVHSATLKKWTTGHGNAKKADMVLAVMNRWGRRVDTDDEADAIALLYFAKEQLVAR